MKKYCEKGLRELCTFYDGSVIPCCITFVKFPAFGNLKTGNLKTIWNNSYGKQFRRSIIDGSMKYCNHEECPQFKNNNFKTYEELDPLLQLVVDRGTGDFPEGPMSINHGHDLSCNLECPSCRTGKIMWTGSKANGVKLIHDKFDQIGKDIVFMHVSSSCDPFGSPNVFKWLQGFKKETYPNLERMHLHTNGVLWNEYNWNKFPDELKKIIKQAEITIDSCSPTTYIKIRSGGNFEILMDNMEFICSLGLEKIIWNFVIQEDNYREMVGFIELSKKFNVDVVNFTLLRDWHTWDRNTFLGKCVHLESHPDHEKYLEIISDPIFSDPKVILEL